MDQAEKYALWCEHATADPDLRLELSEIASDSDAIFDRFYKDLEFGTGGLRGVIGAGTNRMNVYTVGRATQGLADYILSKDQSGSAAIAYDSRNKSELFARTAAEVLAANGIKVHLYDELMPTPMLSFAVRTLSCTAGIVITASHNPAKYNGYKAYGPDGCQLNLEDSEHVLSLVEKVDLFSGIKLVPFDDALKDGRIAYIDHSVIDKYLDCVAKQTVHPEVFGRAGLSVIYGPLHGAGNKPVRAILNRMGIADVTVVPEQELPDGNFPTAPFPNPEIRESFTCAIKMAKTIKADLLLATDPDCDRVGIAVRRGDDYTLMSGNEVGVLLLHYILSQRLALGTLPERPMAVKTIVSTPLCCKVAEKYGCEIIDVLTGFKFIGEQIGILEKKGEQDRYVFGFEESYGYLTGTYVRDKDAVVSSMMICEMASYYKLQGKSLLDVMEGIYDEFGMYLAMQLNYTCEGATGMAKMDQIMDDLRRDAPLTIGGVKTTVVFDYGASASKDIATGAESVISLPSSNVLSYQMANGGSVIIRPSGTEPKIKVYLSAVGKDRAEAELVAGKFGDDISRIMGF